MKTIVTVLVLAVWAACTGHCAIESLRGAGGLPCCNEDGGQSDQAPQAPGHCVCGAIQAGGYVSQDSAISIPRPPDGFILLVVAPQPADAPTQPANVEPALSPPRALEHWQFLFRTALPVRAPSLIS